MSQLGAGLYEATRYEDALPVMEAELSMKRRHGASERDILVAQSNLAGTYSALGRHQDSLRIKRDAYSGCVRLFGEEHEKTLLVANNCASSLNGLRHFAEARSLLRKTIPVARRVLGECHQITLTMRWQYARAFYGNPGATLDDLREAVTMFEETERIALRVLGGAHPLTEDIQRDLRAARAFLRARETPPTTKSQK